MMLNKMKNITIKTQIVSPLTNVLNFGYNVTAHFVQYLSSQSPQALA